MRIIALYGRGNCGKSETLLHLKDMLRTVGTLLSHSQPWEKDSKKTFRYHDQTICVTPGGDNLPIIRANLAYLEQEKGDILVTAARTRGAGVDRLNRYAHDHGIQVEWVKKAYDDALPPHEQDNRNRQKAEKLLGLL